MKNISNEDWCCFCYGVGLLVFCDQEECLKACHPKCVGKDDSFVNSGSPWTCDAHSCFICHKDSSFNCAGCAKALCRCCIGLVEFVQIKGKKGLCCVCLKFGILVEEKKDADFDKDFMDHFSRAWKIINKRECMTLDDLLSARDRMKQGNKGIQDNNRPFDEQLEAILRTLPERYSSTIEVQPRDAVNNQGPKWNILIPGGVVTGPYPLDSLKCLLEVYASSSQYLMVWKEGETKDTAIKLPNAGHKGVEDNGPPFDEQLEAILRTLPKRYSSATKVQSTWNVINHTGVVTGPYPLDSLNCLLEVYAFSSQYLTVWKEGESKDTAIKLTYAVKLFS